jgi:superfamily I DNA/RNA helicase
MMIDIKSELSDEQLEIVKSNKNILLRACPGSGKTRVITYKIAYVLERRLNKSKDVIAITYTNRAANEIVSRVDKMGIDTKYLWVGTIHKFCLDYIISNYRCYLTELKNGYRIIDEYEKRKIWLMINESEALHVNLFDLIYVLDTNGKPEVHNSQKELLLKEYYDYLRENNLIDFDLILYYSYLLLEKYPIIGSRLNRIISSVYVDEYQDTQELQYRILSLIMNSNDQADIQLLFVGDIDQAIYTSLGGVVKNKFELESIFSGYVFREKTLAGCYRSTQAIVDYYSYYLNEYYQINAIGSNRGEKSKIVINETVKVDQLADSIAGVISREIEAGVLPKEICVAAPAWRLLFPISKSLKEKLPHIQFDAPDIAPMKRDQLNLLYRISKILLIEVRKENYSRYLFEAKAIKELLIAECGIDIRETDTSLVSIILSSKSNSKRGSVFLRESINNAFNALGIIVSNHSTLNDKFDMYFESISARSQQFDIPDELNFYKNVFKPKSGVVLSSCHGVKGEEYHTFIAYGLLEDIIPHFNAVKKNEKEAVCASKRLLYVCASRAKNNLFLVAERRTKWGNFMRTTRILEENI